MSDILISVVVPLYNSEEFIGKCLDSLLAQTFRNFEVIIVDDCSTDNSLAIVNDYVPKFDGRLKLTQTKKNSGGSYAPHNIGFKSASGKYIYFADAADYLLNTALETLYDAAERYDAEVVYTASHYNVKAVDDIRLCLDGEGKKLVSESSKDKLDFRVDEPERNLRNLLLEEYEGNFRTAWTKFVRRNFLTKNKILFPEISTGGDFIWSINLYCQAKRFLRLPTPLYFHRENVNSDAGTEPSDQVARWVSAFPEFMKNLNALEEKNEILSKNPAYCLAAYKSHFEWLLNHTAETRKELTAQDIYEILSREFAKESSDLPKSLLPFLFSFIDNVGKEVAQLKSSFVYPAISVIISLYNAEEFIDDCLNSLLNQTLQNFEVIVVDDCSADNSAKIVKEYAPKFNGRLKLTKTKKNSGGDYIPRNLGLSLACGEYIYFMNADDLILNTALETFYNAANENAADVVYSSAFYDMKKTDEVNLHKDGFAKSLIEKELEDKTELTANDTAKIFQEFLASNEGNFRATQTKFVRRDFLLKNEILFPNIPAGGDCIWSINVYAHAKRFLRLPVPLYYCRNYNSVTQKARSDSEEIAWRVSAFTAFLRAFNELQNQTEILSKNLNWGYAAVRDEYFEFYLRHTAEARKNLSNQAVYDALYNEFAKNNPESAIPFFLAMTDNESRVREEYLQTIQNLQKEIVQIKNELGFCAVSVIIPLYNAEKYIGECLDSLLEQTFQNFEIIVVDDCSTDNSFAIVESYVPKFDGRLKLTQTKKNSGGNGLPRNKGLSLAKGEYVQFLNADDMLTKTALEELYALAKENDADVVDCTKRYTVNEDDSDIQLETLQKGKLSDKPVFESANLSERVGNIVRDFFTISACSKFVRRNLLAKNKIFFPQTSSSEDEIWTYGLAFHADKFLHVPLAVYIRRLSESSVNQEQSPQEQLTSRLNPALFGLKNLDDLMSGLEYFQKNPKQRYAILKKFVKGKLNLSFKAVKGLSAYDIYATIKDELGDKLGDCDVLIPALCASIYNEELPLMTLDNEPETLDSDAAEILAKFKRYFSIRLDIQMLTNNQDDFEILSVSDDRADVRKPAWFQKNGVGYIIQSYVGSLNIVFDVIDGGTVNLNLKGLFYADPKKKSKHIPYWVDYTKFTVNDNVVFDELKPVWHDAPYNYKFEAKAGEQVTINIEWLPHRSDT